MNRLTFLFILIPILFGGKVGAQCTADISGVSSPICYNTSPGTFTAAVTGDTGPFTYLWYENSVSTGITTPTYQPGNLIATSSFYCVINSGICGTITSNTVIITVFNNASIESVTGASPLCINGTATYTANNVVPGGGTGSWSSSNTAVANVNSSGLVTGVSAGTCNIIYTITAGCGGTVSAQKAVTIDPNASIASVTGTSSLCINGTGTYSANTVVLSGGTGAWSSSNTAIATVNSSGLVTGVSTGICNIIYTIIGGCGGTVSAQQSLTISPNASIASVTGTSPLCINETATYAANTVVLGGGTGSWSSSNTAIATVNSSGLVTGVSAGTCNIIYTVTGGCGGTVSAHQSVTITPNASIASVTGTSQLCINGTATFTVNSVVLSGGTGSWSSSNAAIATVNSSGLVTGISAGTCNIIYTITGGCGGTVSAQQSVTVNPNASIVSVTGTSPLCIAGTATYSANTVVLSGGTGAWSSSNTAIATVNSSGLVTGVSAGTCNIIYTITGGCGGTVSAQQSVTISANAVITLTSGTGTNVQTLCINSSITNIIYSVTNATGAGVTNLPSGLTGVYSGGIFTISGTTNGTGTFNYVVTTTGACTQATATGTITVNPLPVPTLSSSDADNIICQGASVTFTAGGGTTYNFRVGGVSAQSGPSTTFTTTTLINGQAVDVIVTNSNGCSATSNSITNFVNPLPFIFITTAPSCSSDLTTYSLAVVVSTGTVTSTAGTVTNSGANVWTISGVPSGTNITAKVTDSGGCENTVVITAPNCSCPVVLAPVSGGDQSYCESGTVPTISATVPSGETVDWYDSSSGGTLLKSSSLSYTPSGPGTFYALARNTTTGCLSSTRTPVIVTRNPLPVPSIISSDADNIICSGTSVTFTGEGGTNYNFRVGGVSVQNSASSTYTTSSLINGQVVDVIVTNANGCTATSAGITTTVNDLPVATLNSSDSDNKICLGATVTFTAGGGTSYNFRVAGTTVQNGPSAAYITNSLADGQVVDVIVSNANGCTATSAGITNTVYPLPVPTLTSSDADNTFCSGTSITFSGGGGTNFNFRVGGVSVQNGTSPNYTTHILTNGQVVDVLVTASNGCSATSAGITNTVITNPTANAGTGGNECDLNFTFNAVPSNGVGIWTLTSGPGTVSYSPDPNSPTATVTVSAYGTYTFTWTEVNATCINSSSVTVNFYKQPVSNPGTGGNNCGLDFFLNAVPSIGTGTWTKTAGTGTVSFTPDENTPNAKVTVSTYGQYTFKWTEVNGTCSSNASININFVQATVADAGTGGDACGLSFKLNAQAGTSPGTWTKYNGPGNAVFKPNANQPNATVTVDKVGTYDFAWTVANVTCKSVDTVRVIFHNLPTVSVGKDTVICKGNSVQLQARGLGSFKWVPDSLLDNPYIPNPVTQTDTTTVYKVTLTDNSGCQNSDSLTVEVWNNPVANAGHDQVLDYTFETTMDAVLTGLKDNGAWSVISGSGTFLDKNDAKTTVTKLSVGINKFLWKVTNGICPPSLDTAKIVVNDLVIPTLITPNMDGKNDYFVLRGLTSLGRTELIIFDRRGAQVYKNMNYDNSWNGVDYNGRLLPDDTYFFILRAANGKSASGYIVIRR